MPRSSETQHRRTAADGHRNRSTRLRRVTELGPVGSLAGPRRKSGLGRPPEAMNGCFVEADREEFGLVVWRLRSGLTGSYGSISYSQGGRSNDRDMSTAVLRAGSANALRGHRQCRGPAVPTIPAGRSGTFMDGSPRSAGVAAACTHGDGRQLWQADDGVPPVQSALRNAINLSSGR